MMEMVWAGLWLSFKGVVAVWHKKRMKQTEAVKEVAVTDNTDDWMQHSPFYFQNVVELGTEIW